jgi:dephospho-CoA kinase
VWLTYILFCYNNLSVFEGLKVDRFFSKDIHWRILGVQSVLCPDKAVLWTLERGMLSWFSYPYTYMIYMPHPIFKVGLTGGIASGKTTVSKLFAQLGVPIIDADIIAHALVQPGQPALTEIIEAYGTEIINPEGGLDRAKLRERVFSDASQRLRLEGILHPRIRQAMLEQVAQQRYPYCILSIPLLVETQQWDLVDSILVVDCLEELQRTRLRRRSQLTDAEIDQILEAQVSRPARLAISHNIIENNDGLDQLELQVKALHLRYLTMNNGKWKMKNG